MVLYMVGDSKSIGTVIFYKIQDIMENSLYHHQDGI